MDFQNIFCSIGRWRREARVKKPWFQNRSNLFAWGRMKGQMTRLESGEPGFPACLRLPWKQKCCSPIATDKAALAGRVRQQRASHSPPSTWEKKWTLQKGSMQQATGEEEQSWSSGQYQWGRTGNPLDLERILYAVTTEGSHSYVRDDLYYKRGHSKTKVIMERTSWFIKKLLDTAKAAEQFLVFSENWKSFSLAVSWVTRDKKV